MNQKHIKLPKEMTKLGVGYILNTHVQAAHNLEKWYFWNLIYQDRGSYCIIKKLVIVIFNNKIGYTKKRLYGNTKRTKSIFVPFPYLPENHWNQLTNSK